MTAREFLERYSDVELERRQMEITTEQFDSKLAEILDRAPASYLLFVPGVYEILAEEYNNQVLEEIEESTKLW